MEIGYDQGACVGPPERALGEEIDLFARDRQHHIVIETLCRVPGQTAR